MKTEHFYKIKYTKKKIKHICACNVLCVCMYVIETNDRYYTFFNIK